MSATKKLIDGPRPGVSLAVEERGGSADPVTVWLHGEWGMTHEDVLLADAGVDGQRLIAPHHPGWGHSTGAEQFASLSDLAIAYWWLLDSLEVDGPVLLAGLGMGAALAAEMAVQQPQRADGLVLVGPAGIWDDDIGGADIFSLLPKDVMPALYADPSGPAARAHFPAPTDAYDKAMAGVRRAQTLGPASRYIFPLADTGIAERLYRLNSPRAVPTTLVWGEKDGVYPIDLASVWQRSVPHAELEVVDGAGHMVLQEQPERFVKLLTGIPRG